LKDLLKKQRSSIIEKWFDCIIESYPADTAEFLKRKGGFGNPIGQTASRASRTFLTDFSSMPTPLRSLLFSIPSSGSGPFRISALLRP